MNRWLSVWPLAAAFAMTSLLGGCGGEAGSDLGCGVGTVERDGQCVATPPLERCDEGLVRRDGECVQPSPNCGPGTAYDVVTGECVPSEAACQEGTSYDPDTYRCVADTDCAAGDVLVDGICVDEAAVLADSADLVERENNDPALGGIAERIFLDQPVEGGFVFAGAIEEPRDFDADGTVDQDVDVYQFTADEGDWLEIVVRSTGMPSPAFKIEGPEGSDFVRWSPVGHDADAARHVVIPAYGTYTLTVLPTLTLQRPDEYGVLGGEDWGYVGSIGHIQPPDALEVDLSAGSAQFDGALIDLTDNYFTLKGAQPGDLVRLDIDAVGQDADGFVQIWEGGDKLQNSRALTARKPAWVAIPDDGDVRVLVDWAKVRGSRLNFELSAKVAGRASSVTLAPGESVDLEVAARPFDTIVASFELVATDSFNDALSIAIGDPSGVPLTSEIHVTPAGAVKQTVVDEGTYTVTFHNRHGEDKTIVAMARLVSPDDLGDIAADSTVESAPTLLLDDQPTLFRFDVEAGQVIEIGQSNPQDESVYVEVIDASGAPVIDRRRVASVDGFRRGASPFWRAETATTVLLSIESSYPGTADQVAAVVRSVTPESLGPIAANSADTAPWSAPLSNGQAGYHLIDFTGPIAFWAAATPVNPVRIRCELYDEAGELVQSEYEAASCQFGRKLESAGQYLMRVIPTRDPLTGYDLSVTGIPEGEDLGAVGADASVDSTTVAGVFTNHQYRMSFSVEAGQLIAITHDNANRQEVELRLYDADGNLLDHRNRFAPRSNYDGGDVLYWYASQAAALEVSVEGGYRAALDEVVRITTSTPATLGTLGAQATLNEQQAQGLQLGRSDFYRLSVPETVALSAALTAPNSLDVDLAVYDLDMTALISRFGYEEVSLSSAVLPAGEYLVRIAAGDQLPSYSLELSSQPGPGRVSAPFLAIPTNLTTATDTIDIPRCGTVSSVEAFINVDHASPRWLDITLVSPRGVRVKLHESTYSSSTGGLFGWYPSQLTPVDSMSAFEGMSGHGAWTLEARDRVGGTEGSINLWALDITCL